MSKKRAFNAIESECQPSISDQRPTKKIKTNDGLPLQIKSIWLSNSSDQSQFKRLFADIYNSPLSKALQISHIISKEIAEYASGHFVECANTKCVNQIPTLCQDEEIYGNAYENGYENKHKNCDKLGYKRCMESDKYYCNECMALAKQCECGCSCCSWEKLHFVPDCDKCSECEAVMIDCDCFDQWECDNIHCDYKCCNDCFGVSECVKCENWFCAKCVKVPKISRGWDEYCVCNDCFDSFDGNAIITCDECNAKCKLLYESNPYLLGVNGGNPCGNQMEKCRNEGCNIYICLNCDAKVRNGKEIHCAEQGCFYFRGYLCNSHFETEQQWICFRHRT